LKSIIIMLSISGITIFGYRHSLSYPPAVGILSNAKNCLVCHASNGSWQDEEDTIIDILDGESHQSLLQPDSSFLIAAERGEPKTVLTVIGRSQSKNDDPPYRNAWLYIDQKQIGSSSLSKFAPGWSADLPFGCRLVGDKLKEYETAHITVLPMTVLAGDDARNGELMLQVMLTKGDSVKGNPRQGMIGNYFERQVYLKVY